MLELVIDFSSNLFVASTDNEAFVANITPNNYLAAMDFLKQNNYIVNEDFVDEVEYSIAEY